MVIVNQTSKNLSHYSSNMAGNGVVIGILKITLISKKNPDKLEEKQKRDGGKASIKPISALPTTADQVEAAPKGTSSYSWFAYTGAKPLTLKSQGGSTLVLEKGDKFGTRPSSTGNGKFIRLIGEKTGVTKVFTLAFDTIAELIKNCKPAKAVMASVENTVAAPDEIKLPGA